MLEVDPLIPESMVKIVAKALAKTPEGRYQNGKEMAGGTCWALTPFRAPGPRCGRRRRADGARARCTRRCLSMRRPTHPTVKTRPATDDGFGGFHESRSDRVLTPSPGAKAPAPPAAPRSGRPSGSVPPRPVIASSVAPPPCRPARGGGGAGLVIGVLLVLFFVGRDSSWAAAGTTGPHRTPVEDGRPGSPRRRHRRTRRRPFERNERLHEHGPLREGGHGCPGRGEHRGPPLFQQWQTERARGASKDRGPPCPRTSSRTTAARQGGRTAATVGTITTRPEKNGGAAYAVPRPGKKRPQKLDGEASGGPPCRRLLAAATRGGTKHGRATVSGGGRLRRRGRPQPPLE